MDGAVSEDDFSLGPRAAGTDQHDEGNPGESHDVELAIRAALNFSIGEVCSAENGKLAMTGSAVSTLAELVFKYTEALALDLRVFAKHGKRAVVGVDDVKCAARKDPKLVEKLATFEAARNLSAGKSKKTTLRRKKASKNQNQNQNQNQRRPNAGSRAEGECEEVQDGLAAAAASAAPATLKRGASVSTGGSGSGGGRKPSGGNFVNLLDENDDEYEVDKEHEAAEEEGDREVFRDQSHPPTKWTTGSGWAGGGGGCEGGVRNRNGGGRYGSDHNESDDDDLLL